MRDSIFGRAIGRAIAALLLSATYLASAHATPNLLGGYSGTFNVVNTRCGDPADDGPLSGTISFTITTQVEGAGSGTGTVVDDEVSSLTISFAVDSAGVVLGGSLVVEDDPGPSVAAILSGTFVDGVLSASITGGDTPPGCLFSGSFTASRSADSVLVPENEAPSEVTGIAGVTSSTQTVTNTLGTRIGAALSGRTKGASAVSGGFMLSSGLAASEGSEEPLGAWLSYSRIDSKNDFSTTAFSSDQYTVLGGVDMSPWENWVLGVAFGLEFGSTDTRFNGGEQDTKGFTMAGYTGAVLTDHVSFDLSIGVSSLRIDQFRTSGGTRVTSDLDAHRVFGSANVITSRMFGGLLASASAGMLLATERQDEFLESDNTQNPSRRFTIGQFRLGGELAYMGAAVEPFVIGLWQHDFTRSRLNFASGVAQPTHDQNDVLLAAGLRYFGKHGLSASVEYNTILGRRNYDQDTVSLTARWEF